MKIKKHNSIHEVAKLFGVTVQTLHFWESKDLFHITKNNQNQYREFTFSDILNIWEIIFYRELNIPIKDIQNILKHDLSNLEQTYSMNEKKLVNEIEKLKKDLDRLQKQKQVIDMIKKLTQRGLKREQPDFVQCSYDPFAFETLQLSLENPYRCCLKISKDHTVFERGLVAEQFQTNAIYLEQNEILWRKKKNPDGSYYSFLLKINIDDQNDNNLGPIIDQIQNMGYITGDIIARYLLIVSEPSVSDNMTSVSADQTPRYEYYKAWIEVFEKKKLSH